MIEVPPHRTINTLVAADLIKQDAINEAKAAVEEANQKSQRLKAAQALTNGQAAPAAAAGGSEGIRSTTGDSFRTAVG